jgi:small conductance mechanosensitive channel
VVNYPRGYVRCIADVTLRGDAAGMSAMETAATQLAQSVYEQFPGILLTQPSVEGRRKTTAGKEFLRIKFRIWPGRGAPIEETFRDELTAALQAEDPAYQDWMIAVYYEVEARLASGKSRGFPWPVRQKNSAQVACAKSVGPLPAPAPGSRILPHDSRQT